MLNQTFTLTFGEVSENHVGMQKIGNIASHGYSLEDLQKVQNWFQEKDIDTELIYLNMYLPDGIQADNAYILLIHKGINSLLGNYTESDLFQEQNLLDKDKKALMRGKVVNKHARYNLCFSDHDQEPDYENGKGTIVSYQRVPILSKLRDSIHSILEEDNLQVEANYYYDISKCYIGFHGDTERKKVFGVRLGTKFPLHYQWYQDSNPISNIITLQLNGGDMYMMSEKAVGCDWKTRKIPTLRHAAGSIVNITK